MALLLAGAVAAPPASAETIAQWDFDGSLASETGQPALVPEASAPASAPGVTFEPVTVHGRSSQAAHFTRGTMFRVHPQLGPNGGGQYVNQFTLVLDALFPDRSPSGGWAALLQTNEANANDADWFIDPQGALGAAGSYHGSVPEGEWHRIAFVVDLVEGSLASYVDGLAAGRVGGQALDGRFSLYSTADGPLEGFLLFADDTSENAEGYIDALQVRDSVLCAEDVAALGGIDDGPLAPTPVAQHDCAPSSDLELKEGPYLQWATESEITVMWETNRGADTTLFYRRAGGSWMEKAGATLASIHEVRVDGFLSGEEVEYYVRSRKDGAIAESPKSTFRTNPPGAPDFRFVVWGDNQANPPVFTSLVRGMVPLDPDLAVACGDVVDVGSDYYRWGAELLTPIQPLAKAVPFYVAIGNHEQNSHWFYDYLAQPGNEHWFSFDYAGCHFVIIDSNFAFGPGSPQYEWLVDDLFSPEAKAAKWLLTFHHHPPYSEIYEEVIYDRLRKHLVPLYEAAGVDMNFTGHIHDYERGIYTPPDTGRRIVYVQTSGGGGRLWDDEFGGDWEQITKVVQYVYHFCEVTIRGEELTLRAIDPDGRVIDSFTITQLPRDGEPPPPPPPPAEAGKAITQWDFERGDFAPTFGPGELEYADREAGDTARLTQFGTTSQLGIPGIAGIEARVLRFPKASSSMGYRMSPDAPANGGGTYINAYSLLVDLYVPTSSFLADRWLALLNTSPSNADDSDIFVDLENGGVGISGKYDGKVLGNAWQRLALVFRVDGGAVTLDKYIDGEKVGTQTLDGVDGRWSLRPQNDTDPFALLFTDDNAETTVAYVSSIAFIDRALTEAEVAALGPADADGILDGPCLGDCPGLFRRGDANIDGSIDVADPIRTLIALFIDGRSPICEKSLDTNDDGLLNVTDVIYELDFLFLGGTAMPEPFPACGLDATPDSLGCAAEGACR